MYVGNVLLLGVLVGLGGLAHSSTSLKQLGRVRTVGDGHAGLLGVVEILPAAPVSLKLPVKPGDTISAAVTISGKTVSMRLRNVTRHTVVNRTEPGGSGHHLAGWIAEAPPP